MFCHGIFKKVFGKGQAKNCFVWGMRAVVVILNVMPLYIINYEMLEYYENKMDKKITKVIFNALCFMNLWSYFVASLKRPQAIPHQPNASKHHDAYCIICENWKPDRTHHCSICETCVPKMDHHCPWLGTCVGFHNYKSFFLFCLY